MPLSDAVKYLGVYLDPRSNNRKNIYQDFQSYGSLKKIVCFDGAWTPPPSMGSFSFTDLSSSLS